MKENEKAKKETKKKRRKRSDKMAVMTASVTGQLAWVTVLQFFVFDVAASVWAAAATVVSAVAAAVVVV